MLRCRNERGQCVDKDRSDPDDWTDSDGEVGVSLPDRVDQSRQIRGRVCARRDEHRKDRDRCHPLRDGIRRQGFEVWRCPFEKARLHANTTAMRHRCGERADMFICRFMPASMREQDGEFGSIGGTHWPTM